MKITSKVREQWTRFLQGQLTAADQQDLVLTLESSEQLTEALTSDARLHALLIEHYAANPEFVKLMGASPQFSRAGGGGDTGGGDHVGGDTAFRQRCMAAVGWGPAAAPQEWVGPSGTAGTCARQVVAPPEFAAGDEGWISSDSPPPVVLEPPPISPASERGAISGPLPDTRSLDWRSLAGTVIFVVIVVAAGLVANSQGDSGRRRSDPASGSQTPVQGGEVDPTPEVVGPPEMMVVAQIAESGDAEARREKSQPDRGLERPADSPVPTPHPAVNAAQPSETGEPAPDQGPVQRRMESVESPVDAANLIIAGNRLPRVPVVQDLRGGQIRSSPDARWETPLGHDSLGERPLVLADGVAEVQLDSGLLLRLRGPATFRVLDSTHLELVDGLFQVEMAVDAEAAEWTVTCSAAVCRGNRQTQLFVNTAPGLGTGLEVRRDETVVVDPHKTDELRTMAVNGFNRGRLLPPQPAPGQYPRAAAWVNEAGEFVGQIKAFDVVLATRSAANFAEIMHTVGRRMRESPEGLASDWRRVVRKLERLKDAIPVAPDREHAARESGDLLADHPELQRELAKGLPGAGRPLGRPRNGPRIGGIFGDGPPVDREAWEVIRQDLQTQLDQLRAERNGAGARGRRRPAPSPMERWEEQWLEAQLKQLEMLGQILNNFGGNPLLLGLPEPIGTDPVVVWDPVVSSFLALATAEGQRESEARLRGFESDLQLGLETAEQRERRLQELREKLHR